MAYSNRSARGTSAPRRPQAWQINHNNRSDTDCARVTVEACRIVEDKPPLFRGGKYQFEGGAKVSTHDHGIICDTCMPNTSCVHCTVVNIMADSAFRKHAEALVKNCMAVSDALVALGKRFEEASGESRYAIYIRRDAIRDASRRGLAALKELVAETTATPEAGEIAAEQAPRLNGYQLQLIKDIRANGGDWREIEYHLSCARGAVSCEL